MVALVALAQLQYSSELTLVHDPFDRSLPARSLPGISEKQRRFQTYDAAPDDEAAARTASATRASLSAPWTYTNDAATLDDLREAVETLESVVRVWTRVFGEAHPETPKAQDALKIARGALAARRAASAGSAS